MSVYAVDRRVMVSTERGFPWYREVALADGRVGLVWALDGGGWVASESTGRRFVTADEAIRSMIGDPR